MTTNLHNAVKFVGRQTHTLNSMRIQNNQTTVRSDNLLTAIPSVKPSRNATEAKIKMLRMYTRVCRLVPFLIRIYHYQKKITPYQFKENVASAFREKGHMRRPYDIDKQVNIGYIALYEAEQHYSDTHHFEAFIRPHTQADGRYGFSYLKEKQYGNRSGFLKDFYEGNRPNAA